MAHSTQVCGVSASFARSSTRRDLPMPGSPTIWTNWPSPSSARDQRRRRSASSSSRPTSGVSARAPPRRAPPARPHDAIERNRRRHALEVVRALVFGDEKPGRLPLHARGDEHRSRFGRGLHARGDVRRLADAQTSRIDHD